MSGRPILSVLIPTRNRAYYLKHAIQSAINIPEKNVEILVSENHSSDNSWEVCADFKDPRLTILRPDKPLPMHQNWEYLLDKASGEWVYFLGDDDAMMSHAASHLQYLTKKYPQCEAIVSPRAYFFWPGHGSKTDFNIRFSFDLCEEWVDSKLQLRKCLDGSIDYLYLPQAYSGGFQRHSLITRVRNSQNGKYFKSVTPDAYSALMACVHTYRYLRIGVPLAWVGTSPSSKKPRKDSIPIKDRDADFWGMHDEDKLVMHRAFGDLKEYTFTLVFWEAYISAIPTTSMWELSCDKMKCVYLDAVKKFRREGKEEAVQSLGKYLGFVPLGERKPGLGSMLKRIGLFPPRCIKRAIKSLRALFEGPTDASRDLMYVFESNCYDQCPDILSCDRNIAAAYEKCMEISCKHEIASKVIAQ